MNYTTSKTLLTFNEHSFFLSLAPLEIEARGEEAQLAYQRALKDGAVNFHRVRVLLIGQDRAGKTSLKRSLIGLPFNPKEKSTAGIEVDSSKRAVISVKHIKGKGVKEKSVVSIELWDFAGQHLYYASHPVFLSSRALYILVCNLSKSLHDTAKPSVRQGSLNVDLENPNGETNLEILLSWLSTVHSVAQMRRETCDDVEEEVPHLRPPVIIVGTHADKPFEDIATMKLEIQNAIAGNNYEGHVVRPIFSIDNTAKLTQRKIVNKLFGKNKNIDDIQDLQVRIMELLRQEPYIGESIPVG